MLPRIPVYQHVRELPCNIESDNSDSYSRSKRTAVAQSIRKSSNIPICKSLNSPTEETCTDICNLNYYKIPPVTGTTILSESPWAYMIFYKKWGQLTISTEVGN